MFSTGIYHLAILYNLASCILQFNWTHFKRQQQQQCIVQYTLMCNVIQCDAMLVKARWLHISSHSNIRSFMVSIHWAAATATVRHLTSGHLTWDHRWAISSMILQPLNWTQDNKKTMIAAHCFLGLVNWLCLRFAKYFIMMKNVAYGISAVFNGGVSATRHNSFCGLHIWIYHWRQMTHKGNLFACAILPLSLAVSWCAATSRLRLNKTAQQGNRIAHTHTHTHNSQWKLTQPQRTACSFLHLLIHKNVYHHHLELLLLLMLMLM